MIRDRNFWINEFQREFKLSVGDSSNVYNIVSTYLLNVGSNVSTTLILRIVREGIIPGLSSEDKVILKRYFTGEN